MHEGSKKILEHVNVTYKPFFSVKGLVSDQIIQMKVRCANVLRFCCE